MANFEPEVLVAGAGPTGLAAAIELQRAGIPYRLIDKSEHAAQWSQALVVQARTLEQFERYGIADEAVEQGVPLRRATFHSEGKTIFEAELDRIPGRYPFVLFLPQSKTEKLLTERLNELGGSIERGTELLSVDDREDRVVTQLRLKDGTEQRVESRWIIGCDGAHSTVREQLGIPFEGEAVGLAFFLGDLRLEGPDVPADELRIYLHRGDVFFVAPLGDNLYRVIVAMHEQSSGDKKLEIADFQGPLDGAGIHITVTGSTWMTPFHVNDRQAQRYRNKSVFLAGDASHIHSPVGGQGMNTGLQDAANLIWKLRAVRDGGPDRLLNSYHEERSAVGKRLLSTTSRGLKAATTGNVMVEKFRDALISGAGHLHQIQNHAVGFISETDIEYRSSSIVKDLGGDGTVHAGDRVPNPHFVFADDHPGTLLDPLQNGNHMLLIIRGGDEKLKAAASRATLVETAGTELNGMFGTSSRVAVIRPDGYLGFRGDTSHLDELADYAKSVGIN